MLDASNPFATDPTITQAYKIHEQLRDRELVVKPKILADRNIANILATAMRNFENAKERWEPLMASEPNAEDYLRIEARSFLNAYDHAVSYNLIEEGEGLVRKQEECDKERGQLKTRIAELEVEKQKWYESAEEWKSKYEEEKRKYDDLYAKYGKWRNDSNSVFGGDLRDAS